MAYVEFLSSTARWPLLANVYVDANADPIVTTRPLIPMGLIHDSGFFRCSSKINNHASTLIFKNLDRITQPISTHSFLDNKRSVEPCTQIIIEQISFFAQN